MKFIKHVVLLMLGSLSLAACDPVNGSGTSYTNTYVGEISGVQATAIVSFEPLKDYTLMSGEITSGAYRYTFTADIIGNRGWGDMVDHSDGSRFRIQIDMTPSGFLLTSNPLLNPTTYSFTAS